MEGEAAAAALAVHNSAMTSACQPRLRAANLCTASFCLVATYSLPLLPPGRRSVQRGRADCP